MNWYQVVKTPGLNNDWVTIGQIVELEKTEKEVTIGKYKFESLRIF